MCRQTGQDSIWTGSKNVEFFHSKDGDEALKSFIFDGFNA
jgi:hypothetical protein